MRIRPPELETSICDAKYHGVGIGTPMHSTRSVLGKWVLPVTLAMSLLDLQDVCIAIGSIATLDLRMVVDLIGIYRLKGPYCTLTTTDWFLQALSVIPRGSWGDVARRSYHDPLDHSIQFWKLSRSVRSDRRSELRRSLGDGDETNVHPLDPDPLGRIQIHHRPLLSKASPPPPALTGKLFPAKFHEENPSAQISSGFLVQADEGIPSPVVDLIDDIYRNTRLQLTLNLEASSRPLLSKASPPPPALTGKLFPAKFHEENPSAQISSGFLVQADEGIPSPVVDLIDDIYRRLP
ncbi:hypothetical protein F511_34406 [Dorcoceras hygrometricum]|uniref:Uncharacterized protein n=1 Tax=Dorcoceras hygrometricum TaxID=472368 RepID=A0A2Z7CYW8_9LAMI|nr:hypothetical protein F511_34406 [Dorcoceras hygrometricum]